MKTIEFNLPNFDGFYHSLLDLTDYIEVDSSPEAEDGIMSQEEYDSIDWKATESNISKRYVEMWVEKNTEMLKELEIEVTYKSVSSPKEYNFRTDDCVCIATYSDNTLNLFKSKCEIDSEFISFIKNNYVSYSGFISFYSNDYKVWLSSYLEEDFDNVVFEGYLNFLTAPLSDDEKIYNLLDHYSEFILKFPQATI